MNPDQEVLEMLSERLDLDDWDDHHRAEEILREIRAAGYNIVVQSHRFHEYSDRY